MPVTHPSTSSIPKALGLQTKDMSKGNPRERMTNRYQGGVGVFIIYEGERMGMLSVRVRGKRVSNETLYNYEQHSTNDGRGDIQ